MGGAGCSSRTLSLKGRQRSLGIGPKTTRPPLKSSPTVIWRLETLLLQMFGGMSKGRRDQPEINPENAAALLSFGAECA